MFMNQHQVPNMILPEAQWFSPNHGEIGHSLNDMFENYKNYTDGAKRQAYKSKTNFSWEGMRDLLDSRLTTLMTMTVIKTNGIKTTIQDITPNLNVAKIEKNEG